MTQTKKSNKVMEKLLDSIGPDLDDIDRDIENYRTDRPIGIAPIPRVIHMLLLLSSYDKFKDGGFTSCDIHFHALEAAHRWDRLFTLEPPFSIRGSYQRHVGSIYSLGSLLRDWIKDDECPYIKTGDKIISIRSAIHKAKLVEYRIHPDLLEPNIIQELIREPFVVIIERLQEKYLAVQKPQIGAS